jgi:hypothetical protein
MKKKLTNKEILQERIRVLQQEIAMSGYYDGWTLRGLKQELKEKLAKLAMFTK